MYTLQEMLRLSDMLKHTFQETITGQLYLGLLELLHLELGTIQPLHKLDFDKLSDLATTSLVKKSWYFLWRYQVYLKTTISKTMPRQGDREIIEGVFNNEVDVLEASAINRCRLYLRAWFVSDITDGSGSFILHEAWTGENQLHSHRQHYWPNQGKPSKEHWDIWRRYLGRYFTRRGRHLRVALGMWQSVEEDWEWYFSIQDRRPYRKIRDKWYSWLINDRPYLPFFAGEGTLSPKPNSPQVASVYRKGDKWVCSGHGPWKPLIIPTVNSTEEALQSGPKEERLALEHSTDVKYSSTGPGSAS